MRVYICNNTNNILQRNLFLYEYPRLFSSTITFTHQLNHILFIHFYIYVPPHFYFVLRSACEQHFFAMVCPSKYI